MTNRPPVRDSKSTGVKSCPSPQCGSPNPSVEGDGCGHFWVRCHGCGMAGPVGDSKDEAVVLWDDLPRLFAGRAMRDGSVQGE